MSHQITRQIARSLFTLALASTCAVIVSGCGAGNTPTSSQRSVVEHFTQALQTAQYGCAKNDDGTDVEGCKITPSERADELDKIRSSWPAALRTLRTHPCMTWTDPYNDGKHAVAALDRYASRLAEGYATSDELRLGTELRDDLKSIPACGNESDAAKPPKAPELTPYDKCLFDPKTTDSVTQCEGLDGE